MKKLAIATLALAGAMAASAQMPYLQNNSGGYLANFESAKNTQSDADIKQALIDESIAIYKRDKGNCPCPYNRDRAGHLCGARSAYKRPGGACPLCYPSDVTQEMVDEYRNRPTPPSATNHYALQPPHVVVPGVGTYPYSANPYAR